MLDTNNLTALPQDFPGMEALSPQTMYLMGCRSFSQLCCTLRSLAKPHLFCPFCATELERRGRKPLLKGARDWMLFENEFPHKNTARMRLVIPGRHITALDEMTSADWAAAGELIDSSGVASGGVMFRFGDPRWNAGTIEHLHINVIEPKPGLEYRPPFAKKLEEHIEDYQRTLGFLAELNQKGGMRWLFSVAGISETQPKVT